MVQPMTSYRVEGTRSAVHAGGMLAAPPQGVRRRSWSAPEIFRRLLTAIVNGSDHPCWRTDDASSQLALLPPREINRLLDSGRVVTKG